jgi:hypothetical protein
MSHLLDQWVTRLTYASLLSISITFTGLFFDDWVLLRFSMKWCDWSVFGTIMILSSPWNRVTTTWGLCFQECHPSLWRMWIVQSSLQQRTNGQLLSLFDLEVESQILWTYVFRRDIGPGYDIQVCEGWYCAVIPTVTHVGQMLIPFESERVAAWPWTDQFWLCSIHNVLLALPRKPAVTWVITAFYWHQILWPEAEAMSLRFWTPTYPGSGKSSEVLDTDALHHKYRKCCLFLTESKERNCFKL